MTPNTNGASQKSEPGPLATSDTVEIHFGFLRQAVGAGACRILDEEGAVETWTNNLRKMRVDIHELAAAINTAAERGAPRTGVSVAWFAGLIRERRALKAAEEQARLPKDLDLMREAQTAPEHREWVQRLKDIIGRQAAAEPDSPERLAALKDLQYELFHPESYCGRRGWIPGRVDFGTEIKRVEQKIAYREEAERQQTTADTFVAEHSKPDGANVDAGDPPF